MKFFTHLAVIFGCLNSFSQTNLQSYPIVDNPARGIDIIETFDSGYLFTGNTFSIQERRSNLLLVKLHSDGKIAWKKELISEDGKSLFGWSLVEVASGYMVLGFSESKTGTKALLVNFNKSGDLIWKKELGNAQQQIGWHMTKSSSGNLLCIGEQENSNQKTNVWFFEVDLTGEIISEKLLLDQKSTERAFYIQPFSNNTYIVTGTSSQKGKENDDILIMNINHQGKALWKKTLDIKGMRDVGHALKTDGSIANIYGYYQQNEGVFNPLVVTIDQNGDIKSQLEVEHPNDIRIMNGAKTEDGHLLVGYTRPPDRDFFKLCLISVNNLGKVIDIETFGDRGMNTAYAIKSIKDGSHIVTGAITKTKNSNNSELLFIKKHK